MSFHPRTRRAAWPLCLLVSMPMATNPAAGDELIWHSDRPLTWADFRGRVAAGAEPQQVAVTAASLRWSYAYELERASNLCSYRITDVSAAALFQTDESWVRDGHRTSTVLAHEQAHFDITQIYTIVFESQTRDEIGVTRPCAGRSRQRAAGYVERDIGSRLNPVYERIWQDHLAVQQAYDRETGHGTLTDAQHRWSERIAAGLSGRQPSDFAAVGLIPSASRSAAGGSPAGR